MATYDEEDISIIAVSDTSRSDSVIVIDDSLTEDPQWSHNGGMEERQALVQIPKYPLLESIGARFAQNRQEQAERIFANKTKREVELAHSQYLKRNVASPAEVAAARPVVKAWADKNDVVGREERRRINARRRLTSVPSHSNSINIRSDTGCNAHQILVYNKSTVQAHNINERASSHVPALDTTQQYEFVNFPQESAINENENLVCSVLNCSAQFSSWPRLANHENLFAHSPCNPLIKIKDIKLSVDPLSYMCAACDEEFMEKDRCLKHISEMDHLPFYPPIAVGAYMCPQCFLLFSSFGDCYLHFESSGHKSISYPFSEDAFSGDIMPVPVAMEMARDFCERCQSGNFFLQCLECELPITSPKALRDHKDETNGHHLSAALTDSSLMEIFATYLKPDICLDCKSLCSEEDQKNNTHRCPNGRSGQIVQNGCKTFTEFVKCCGLTLMKSRDSSKNRRSDKLLDSDSRQPKGKLEISDQKSGKQQTETSATSSVNIPSNGNANRKKRNQSDSPDTHPKKRSRKLGFDFMQMQNNNDERLGNQRDQNKHCVNIPQEIFDGSAEERLIPPDPENLKAMKNIIFLDLDNWSSFFQKLHRCLPDKTFVWGFFGGANKWKKPLNTPFFDVQQSRGLFYLNDRCGRTKDAADVAILYAVGKMDVLLPKHVPFTILSGGMCFKELERQMTKRNIVIIDPHTAQKKSPASIYSMVNSVQDR
ncbi:hypothetical protein CHS0354_026512 [Potamilus streckersoni]|uniref:C2H2-type domain-containing protein n=1 Tax=Potamilus streckersoni TaxID=2493646 RepID=A0AAE0VGZ4_9BIVA|nr:hypothetical protein CHS0354_026512 [Potamilus streckersoni]